MDSPYFLPTLNLTKLGIKINKDVNNDTYLGLYKVHKAGSSHGTSIFASVNIYRNEEIIRATGAGVGEEVADILYNSYGIDILVQVGLSKWILPNNETRFINHSCEPNMGFKSAGVFCAMRHIKKGEELTYDYAIGEINDPTYDWVIDCSCGTDSCRKKISNKDIFNKKLQLVEKYKGYLPKFVLREIAKRQF